MIAFPCNQFGAQEPDVCPRIKSFAQEKYHAQFPMMDKIEVNGENQSPVYATIQSTIPGNVKWNFEKVRTAATVLYCSLYTDILVEECRCWMEDGE